MDSITLENYRCFRKPQTARLAPLTLLVGGNSTGKTSFLALVRALWNVAFQDAVPDFRAEPYDLGAFADVAHNRGGRVGPANSFNAGFEYNRLKHPRIIGPGGLNFQGSFEKRGAFPFPVKRRFERNGSWFKVKVEEDGDNAVSFGMRDQIWQYSDERHHRLDDTRLTPLRFLLRDVIRFNEIDTTETKPEVDNRPQPKVEVLAGLTNLARVLSVGISREQPFAGAPVRSRPRRTYDPTRPSQDPGGEYIPAYLASISYRDQGKWNNLKNALETFGTESGLFDEISIKSLGKSEGAPFQMQIRKFSGRLKGPHRNLIDVGYGVSQALPVLTELLSPDPPPLFLLQQPEVHLHPSAQAAMGSLFCSVAGPNSQLIVETHSDYLLDRVRMDVRDKKTSLKPEDVSILFFEPGDLEVTIHSLGLDEQGNVLDAPAGYGQFFMDEVRRSIGI